MFFDNIVAAPADPILGLTEEFRNDTKPNKINLGVGVYKNDAGETPVLQTVKKAEKKLPKKMLSLFINIIKARKIWN